MKHKIQVLAIGLGLGLCATVGFSATAFADSTCYTGCQPPTTPYDGGSPPVTTSSAGLAFTGADIEGLAAVGAGALVGGGLLLRVRRRRAA